MDHEYPSKLSECQKANRPETIPTNNTTPTLTPHHTTPHHVTYNNTHSYAYLIAVVPIEAVKVPESE